MALFWAIACRGEDGPAKWKYAVVSGNNVYELSDQKAGDKFAGQKVKVTGELKGNTIQVQSIAPAK